MAPVCGVCRRNPRKRRAWTVERKPRRTAVLWTARQSLRETMGKPKLAKGTREGTAPPSLKICAEENVEPPGSSDRPLSTYETLVRSLSDRLVEAQRPIRILDAIKWDDDIERAFFAARCRQLPPVTRDYYLARPLPFDPEHKRQEFLGIERDIRQFLGKYNAAGQIMTRMCAEYRQVLDLLVNRGTPAFSRPLRTPVRQLRRQFSRRRSQSRRPWPHVGRHSR